MKRALVLPLLLALASCGTGRGVATAKVQAPVEMVLGGTSTVTWGQAVPVLNDQPILFGSTECVGIAPVTYVPSPARVTEIRAWTERALRYDLTAGVLVSPLGVDEAKRLLQYLPAIRFYDKPTYNYSRHPDGSWRWMCAQGFSGFDGPKVAADDPQRTERLVVHESTNFYVGLIGRHDLWDTVYVTGIVDAVGQQLTGGWRVATTSTDPAKPAKDVPDVALAASDDTPDLRLAQPSRAEREDVLYVGEREFRGARPLPASVPDAFGTGEPGDAVPATTGAEVGNGGAGHAVAGGDISDLFSGTPGSNDVEGLSVCERRAASALSGRHQASSAGVFHVRVMRDGFKILDPVVGLDAVQVVDLFAVAKRPTEGDKHEAMHRRILVPHGGDPRKSHLHVAVGVEILPEQTFREGKPSAITADGRNRVASDSAQAGDGVPATGFNDGSPFFAFDVVYGTIAGSHVSLLSGSKVRLGVGGATPHRAALILANNPIANKYENAVGAQVTGGWRTQ